MQYVKSVANKLRRRRHQWLVGRRITNPFWARAVIDSGLDPSLFEYDPSKDELRIADLDLRLTNQSHVFLLRGFEYASMLVRRASASFHDRNGEVMVNVGGLDLLVDSLDELYILSEIFVSGVYNVQVFRPTCIIDIGMNVGYSSLRFAQQPNVDKIIAFEPVETTRERALRNLALNDNDLASKIEIKDFGLSDLDGTVTVEFAAALRGSVGVKGLAHRTDIDPDQIEYVPLSLRSAAHIIDRIATQNQNLDLILKIDCEGSELKILESLAGTAGLGRVSLIMMEWHDSRELAALERLLLDDGFKILSLDPTSQTTGMVYAFR